MKTYICPGCGHEQQAEEPPLCEKCAADWSHAKSRMVPKSPDSHLGAEEKA